MNTAELKALLLEVLAADGDLPSDPLVGALAAKVGGGTHTDDELLAAVKAKLGIGGAGEVTG